MINRFFLASIFCGIILLSGCSINYQKEGRRGILGFAWIEYRTDDAIERNLSIEGGKKTFDHVTPVVQQKTFGFYLDTSENSSGVGFGYRDIIIVAPEMNAESILEYDTSNPLGAYYKVTKKD